MTSVVWDKVDRIASHAPVFVAPNEDLRGAASTMWQYNVGVLLVGDQRRLLGVISERDVVAALARGINPDTMTVADAMTPGRCRCNPGTASTTSPPRCSTWGSVTSLSSTSEAR